MGLYINQNDHQQIYKNNKKIKGVNQSYYKRDYLTELLKEQQKRNHILHQSISAIKTLNQQQQSIQVERFENLVNQLYKIEQKNNQNEQNYYKMINQLEQLERENKKVQQLIQHDQSFEKEIKNEIQSLSTTHQKILNQLETNYNAFEEKINEQQNDQKKISTQLNKQAENQQKLTNRLDNNEALLEKVMRQIEFIRSSLFERTSFLAEKIENGYFITSSYLTQLITGSPNIPKESRMLEEQKRKQKQ